MVRRLRPENRGAFGGSSDALDGDCMKLSYAEPISHLLGCTTPRSIFGGGAPVSPVNMPTKLKLIGPKRKILDFNNSYHMLLVSKRFLEIAERFQKEIQYFPVECFWRDGTPAGQMVFFFTTVLKDSVDRERTTVPWHEIPNGMGMWRHGLPEAKGKALVFSRAKIGIHHIWVDPHLLTMNPFVTEEFYATLKKEKIRSFLDSPKFEEA